MTKTQIDTAFDLAAKWEEGEQEQVIKELRSMNPIVAIAVAFQISARLGGPGHPSDEYNGNDVDFQNHLDDLAGEDQ